MDELRLRLDGLLRDLAELEQCAALDEAANATLLIIARRGTRQEIAEVRRLMSLGEPIA